jgi:selenocysteine lyase/cysteine desulfurase
VDVLAGLDPAATGTRRERLVAGFTALEAYEDVLRLRMEEGLAALPQVRVHSRAADRTPTLLLTLEGHSTVDAYGFLAERGIAAPSGAFYAVEASRHLGLGDTGGLRVGLAPYNTTEDIDRLLEGLTDFLRRP